MGYGNNPKTPVKLSFLDKHLKHYFLPEGSSRIYFLISRGNLIYVGKTNSLEKRIISHQYDKSFDTAFFLDVPLEKLHDVEKAFITFLKPAFNKQHWRGTKMEAVKILNEAFNLELKSVEA